MVGIVVLIGIVVLKIVGSTVGVVFRSKTAIAQSKKTLQATRFEKPTALWRRRRVSLMSLRSAWSVSTLPSRSSSFAVFSVASVEGTRSRSCHVQVALVREKLGLGMHRHLLRLFVSWFVVYEMDGVVVDVWFGVVRELFIHIVTHS